MASNKAGPPCFIVSTGRCGSQMLADVLNLHPKLAAFHEPRPLLIREAYLRWANLRSTHYALKALRAKRDDMIEKAESKGFIYVDSAHFHSHLIPELEQRYEPRFVHLYRNGLYFTRSGLERGWYKRRGILHGIKRWLRRHTGLSIGNKWEEHRLNPPRCLTTPFERIAWLWGEINREILRHLENVPNSRRTEVCLEEFDRTTLKRLLHFLSVPIEAAPVEDMMKLAARKPNRTKSSEISYPDRWSTNRRIRFKELASPMMGRLGYEPY